MRHVKTMSWLCLFGLGILSGCSSGPKMAEVEGKITLNGQPLDQVQVEFLPETPGPRSTAVTDAQGRYSLMSDDGKQKGASVGAHRVVLRDLSLFGGKILGRRGEDVDLPKGKKPRLGDRYGDVQKTPLKKEVKSGQNTIDLEVTP